MLSPDIVLPADYMPATVNGPLESDRSETFYVEHLNSQEQVLRRLDGISGGSLQLDAESELHTGGSLDATNIEGVMFGRDRVRIWWDVENAEPWSWGVYLIDADETTHTGTDAVGTTITLTDKLDLLASTGPDGIYSIARNSLKTTAIKTIIEGIGESAAGIQTSDEVIKPMYVAEVGQTWLSIIQDLTPTGWRNIWTDRNGLYQLGPAPEDPATVRSFVEGPSSIHLPDWSENTGQSQVPNVLRVSSNASGTDRALSAVVRNTDPDDPTSIPNRGREVQAVESVDINTTAKLKEYAAKRLPELVKRHSQLSVQHANVPLWFWDTIAFQSQGTDVKATVKNMSFNLKHGELIQANWEVC